MVPVYGIGLPLHVELTIEMECGQTILGVGWEEGKTNRKGCDIGYAPAISSCEGAYSVDACTVTALDAITAFAVPNPDTSSQSRRIFRVWLPPGHPAEQITQPTSDWQILFEPILSIVDGRES